ncbi:MAG: hypothetical protein ACRD3O_07100, partial [Terriglobia bacterium]
MARYTANFYLAPVVTTAILTLAAGIRLAAAQKSQQRAEAPAASSPASVAVASVPRFPNLPASPCAAVLPCHDLAMMSKQMLSLINADRLDPAYSAETEGLARALKWD